MKTKTFIYFSLMITILGCLTACSKDPKKNGTGRVIRTTNVATDVDESDVEEIATDAYIYGYPLVTMEMTRRVMTNASQPGETKAPMGQFAHARKYPDASFHDVTAPNADTLYSTAWLDLSNEPYVLHLPNAKGRYYLMPMLSAWTDVFASLGTRTKGTDAGDYAITGPDWSGTLPAGVVQIKSPTNLVWILGRTYSSGTPEDYKLVHALQNQYTLTPLSAYGQPYMPPRGSMDLKIDVKTPVRDQVNNLDATTFFTMLAQLMKSNPPAADDAPMIARMEKIGIVLGQDFDPSRTGAQYLENAPQLGYQKMQANQSSTGRVVNGWVIPMKTGDYGTDYLLRASVAAFGLGANLPQDAIYPYTSVDSTSAPLSGDNLYVLHFNKDQMPAVNGFWSLTMYNSDYFFATNPLNRYTLSQRNSLKTNIDGSMDLYIQNRSPGKDKEANWLPAPTGKFILMLRLYWPKESVLNGTWKPPLVSRVSS